MAAFVGSIDFKVSTLKSMLPTKAATDFYTVNKVLCVVVFNGGVSLGKNIRDTLGGGVATAASITFTVDSFSRDETFVTPVFDILIGCL